MVMNKIVSFRTDKLTATALEQGKVKYGFHNDSDYIRFLIMQSELNTSLINIGQRLSAIEQQLNGDRITKEIQGLKVPIVPKRIKKYKR